MCSASYEHFRGRGTRRITKFIGPEKKKAAEESNTAYISGGDITVTTTTPISESIRAMLVDDHSMVRAGLRCLIESQPGILVVGEAGNLSDAFAVANREQPDIILLDLIMGSETGLDYVPELLAASKTSRIIILTSVNDSKMHQRALQVGAMGIVVKEEAPDVLIKAIKKVHEGEAWVDRATMANLLVELSNPNSKNTNGSESAKLGALTKREKEIISLVAQGLKNKQIASSLCISEITVRHHLTTIFSKLDVADRFELIVYAYRSNLCDLPG